MSRSNYGYIAFKQTFSNSTPDEDIVLAGQELARKLKEIVEASGGELSTLEEVAAKSLSSAPRIGEMSIRDAAEGKGI